MPAPDYWYQVGAAGQSKLNASGIQGIWVVGGVWDDGSCYLNFPSSARYPEIDFANTDENERYLDYFDSKGVSIYLQVEPGMADVDTLIKLVLGRYGRHPCVAGFGIDVEWYRNPGGGYQHGKPVTDDEAAEWYDLVSSYNASYQLFLKHWELDWMPPNYRKGIYFISDSSGFRSLNAMVREFKEWGQYFPNSPVGFQIGYPEDKSWWGNYPDPYKTIGRALIDSIPNARGIYWVDFTVRDLYPAPV